MTVYENKIICQIAQRFIDIIQSWLKPEQLNEVDVRNRRLNILSEGELYCHTNDFCDANQAMINAYEYVIGAPWDTEEEITPKAWKIAKKHGFSNDIPVLIVLTPSLNFHANSIQAQSRMNRHASKNTSVITWDSIECTNFKPRNK